MSNPHYQHVGSYLRFVQWAFRETRAGKRIRTRFTGDDGFTFYQWRIEFQRALLERINLKGNEPVAVCVPRYMRCYHRDQRGELFVYGGGGPNAGRRVGWRKLDPDYQRQLQLDARRINTPRLLVRRSSVHSDLGNELRLQNRLSEE